MCSLTLSNPVLNLNVLPDPLSVSLWSGLCLFSKLNVFLFWRSSVQTAGAAESFCPAERKQISRLLNLDPTPLSFLAFVLLHLLRNAIIQTFSHTDRQSLGFQTELNSAFSVRLKERQTLTDPCNDHQLCDRPHHGWTYLSL